ncbi:MAG: DUF192 domain-containing protein [Alphaproteobacteria bacterium]|nr:DUF192 domain-containing protein [Alphaproteobacteria bacterium]
MLFSLCGLFASPLAALESFAVSKLGIASGGKTHSFTVELALTPAQRAQGLMWRRRIPADGGMLFLYPTDRVIQMWMKNTLIPLDMLFIDRAGLIVRVKQRAVPGSLAPISSGLRARAVLELRGGTAARLGLKTGDRVLHRAFGTRP